MHLKLRYLVFYVKINLDASLHTSLFLMNASISVRPGLTTDWHTLWSLWCKFWLVKHTTKPLVLTYWMLHRSGFDSPHWWAAPETPAGEPSLSRSGSTPAGSVCYSDLYPAASSSNAPLNPHRVRLQTARTHRRPQTHAWKLVIHKDDNILQKYCIMIFSRMHNSVRKRQRCLTPGEICENLFPWVAPS